MELNESDSVDSFFESFFKKSRDFQVWPPSKEILKQELTAVSNALTVYMAVMVSKTHDRLPGIGRLEQKICQSLDRVCQCLSESTRLSSKTSREQYVVKHMDRILQAIKDPIIHFKALDVLGTVVTLCGLTCLLVKMQWCNMVHIKQVFSIFQEMMNLLSEDTLQVPLPYKNGQLEDKLSQDCCGNGYPCVHDFVSIILCLCPSYTRDNRVAFKPWQWLDIICLCREQMKSHAYISAMEHLETLLNTQLEPETRSIALCMFAQCYFHQDCSQLALQTYKSALKADKSNYFVLFYLADLYRTLKQDDLELESLNLLVRLLTDKHLRSEETSIPDLHLDALVFPLCGVLPTINLISALHHFARRCSQLQRYTEASEQYMTLLKFLEEDLSGTSPDSIQGVYGPVDVQEVVVEVAEALAMAQQADKCLCLFDQFYPVLVMDDSLFLSASGANDTKISYSSMNDSQDSIFGTPHHPCSAIFASDENKAVNLGADSNDLSFKNLFDVTRRKRQRSESFSMDVELEGPCGKSESEQEKAAQVTDPWWPSSLAVRLLLSKADVLIPSQGYSGEVMSCLNGAQDLLLKDSVPIFKQAFKDSNMESEITKSPSHKRRRVVPDILEEPSSLRARPKSSWQHNVGKTIAIANQYEVSDLWRQTMLKVAQRMHKAYTNSGQIVSAGNVLKLLQQLAPDEKSSQVNDPSDV